MKRVRSVFLFFIRFANVRVELLQTCMFVEKNRKKFNQKLYFVHSYIAVKLTLRVILHF